MCLSYFRILEPACKHLLLNLAITERNDPIDFKHDNILHSKTGGNFLQCP